MQAVNSSLSQRTATASKDLSIASSTRCRTFSRHAIPFGYPTVAVKAYQDGSDGGDQSLILLRNAAHFLFGPDAWVMSPITAVKHLFPSTSQVDKEISSGTSVPCLVRPGSHEACQLGQMSFAGGREAIQSRGVLCTQSASARWRLPGCRSTHRAYSQTFPPPPDSIQ